MCSRILSRLRFLKEGIKLSIWTRDRYGEYPLINAGVKKCIKCNKQPPSGAPPSPKLCNQCFVAPYTNVAHKRYHNWNLSVNIQKAGLKCLDCGYVNTDYLADANSQIPDCVPVRSSTSKVAYYRPKRANKGIHPAAYVKPKEKTVSVSSYTTKKMERGNVQDSIPDFMKF